ncbi:MAG: AAA family ATPase [Methanomassiliicoccales archaeon]|nr:AAA family ATPase [Methanomassiliicoccales archaeon]
MSDRPKLRPQLIGREPQLERLMPKLSSALAGRGSVIFLSGEAGSGKTRIAEEFQQFARNTGYSCASATCVSGQPAYAPFKKTLAMLSEMEPSLVGLLSYQELCRSEHESSSKAGAGDKEERMLFAARELVGAISERTPLLLRVDDLQYADARTIQMLHFLGRGIADQRAMIVCTFSDDELFDREERPHPLIEAMRIMKREALCEEIPIPPLTEEQLGKALGELLEKDLDDMALSSLYRESGGNPEIAVELALEALRSGAIVLGEEKATMETWRTLGIPTSLRDWVGRKLDALPEDHLRLLRFAALIGEGFGADLLCRAMRRPKLETLEMLDAAVKEYRLYIETEDGFRFRWGIVRRVAIDRMPSATADTLRREIAKARPRRGSA